MSLIPNRVPVPWAVVFRNRRCRFIEMIMFLLLLLWVGILLEEEALE